MSKRRDIFKNVGGAGDPEDPDAGQESNTGSNAGNGSRNQLAPPVVVISSDSEMEGDSRNPSETLRINIGNPSGGGDAADSNVSSLSRVCSGSLGLGSASSAGGTGVLRVGAGPCGGGASGVGSVARAGSTPLPPPPEEGSAGVDAGSADLIDLNSPTSNDSQSDGEEEPPSPLPSSTSVSSVAMDEDDSSNGGEGSITSWELQMLVDTEDEIAEPAGVGGAAGGSNTTADQGRGSVMVSGGQVGGGAPRETSYAGGASTVGGSAGSQIGSGAFGGVGSGGPATPGSGQPSAARGARSGTGATGATGRAVGASISADDPVVQEIITLSGDEGEGAGNGDPDPEVGEDDSDWACECRCDRTREPTTVETLSLTGRETDRIVRHLRGLGLMLLPVGPQARGPSAGTGRPRLILIGRPHMRFLASYAAEQGDVASNWDLQLAPPSDASSDAMAGAVWRTWLNGLAPVPGDVIIIEATTIATWEAIDYSNTTRTVPRASEVPSVRNATAVMRRMLYDIHGGIRVIALGPLPRIATTLCRNPTGDLCNQRFPATGAPTLRLLYAVDNYMRRSLACHPNCTVVGANDICGQPHVNIGEVGRFYSDMLGPTGRHLRNAVLRSIIVIAIAEFRIVRQTRRE